MIRHVLALPLFLAMILVLVARADDTEKSPQKNPERDEAAMRQERLKDQFGDFKASLLRLAQRLERSSRPEDRERAVILKQAIATLIQVRMSKVDYRYAFIKVGTDCILLP